MWWFVVAVVAATTITDFRSSPEGISNDFECAWRALAYKFAQKQLTWAGSSQIRDVFDGLELATMCGQSFAPPSTPVEPTGHKDATGVSVYVDPLRGLDTNSGTISSPFKTIVRAVTATRAAGSVGCTIVLRGGTHYLSDKLALNADDSGLTLTSYPGERAVVSGGQVLRTAWRPFNVSLGDGAGYAWRQFQASNAVYGETPNPNGPVVNFTRTPTADACQAVCANNPRCQVYTWHDATWPIQYNQTCWLRYDKQWNVVPEHDHVAGCAVGAIANCGANVYVADLSGQGVSTQIRGLQFGNFTRGIRARYPNSNPEFIPVYISGGTQWLPPPNPGCNSFVLEHQFPENYRGMFQNYYVGIGGTCARYEVDPQSYWCQPNGRTGGATYCVRSPAGLTYDAQTLPHAPYKNPAGAVVSAWRGDGEWFTWYWEIESYSASDRKIVFGRGGFQGAEGSSTGGRWFIENVFEELDWSNEFYHDVTNQRLYFSHNGTGAPPPDTVFVATNLTRLLELRGSVDRPVVGVSILGVQFSTTSYTYLDPHGVPSGGDWALERDAAVYLEGTRGVKIDRCLFTKLDGNAIMLSGYNRNTTIQNSEFSFLGNNGVAAWGYTDDWDGTGGNQPRYTSMLNNLCHEIGHYEKQSSCYFQAKSCQNTVRGNVMFNMPRAAINLNDGFGGGSDISANLLFNTCRESSDHGPLNTWDRQPFVTTVRDGVTPSVIPAYTDIHHNLMVANYGADGGCCDNDDGSSWYNMYNNFFVYGGHKSDFDGHAKRSWNSVHAYPSVYGERCMLIGNMPYSSPGGEFNEGYWNNTCILHGGRYFDVGGCEAHMGRDTYTVTMHDNRVYAPGGARGISVGCGAVKTGDEWLAQGLDNGTQFLDSTGLADAQVVAWGAAVIGM